MRDDLYSLFQRLTLLHREKLDCLSEISTNEIQLRHLLQSEKTSDLLDIIRADNDIFLKLDSIEFDIQGLIIGVCKKAGIENDNFAKFFLSRNEEPLPELKSLRELINSKMSDLLKEREKLIGEMEKVLAGLEIHIDELKRINRLSGDYRDV